LAWRSDCVDCAERYRSHAYMPAAQRHDHFPGEWVHGDTTCRFSEEFPCYARKKLDAIGAGVSQNRLRRFSQYDQIICQNTMPCCEETLGQAGLAKSAIPEKDLLLAIYNNRSRMQRLESLLH